MKTREEYISHIKTKLDELNAHLASVEHKTLGKKAEATAEWHSQLNELKSKRGELDRTLKELQAASEDSWKSVKDGADKVLGEAKKTFSKVENRMAAAIS